MMLQYKIKSTPKGLTAYKQGITQFFKVFKASTIIIFNNKNETILHLKNTSLLGSNYEIVDFNISYFKELPFMIQVHNAIKLSQEDLISLSYNFFSLTTHTLKYNENKIGSIKPRFFSFTRDLTVNFTTNNKSLIDISLILLLIKFTISEIEN